MSEVAKVVIMTLLVEVDAVVVVVVVKKIGE